MSGRCFFAHGFEGHPDGPKPRYLQSIGLDVVAPRLNAEGLTFEHQVRCMLAAFDAHPDIEDVVASSMGALACAVAATRRPERTLRLVLLAPAVGVHKTFAARLGPERLALWSKAGVLPWPHAGLGRTVDLPWALYTECEAVAEVIIQHPCAVIHGLSDDVIAPADSLALAQRSPGVDRLIFTDDDHRLLKSLEVIPDLMGWLKKGAVQEGPA